VSDAPEFTRRSFGLRLPAVAALVAATPVLADGADQSFRDIYTAEWAWRQAEFPDDEDPEKPIAPYLPSASQASQDARLARWRDVQAKLAALDVSKLSAEDRINFAVYRNQVDAMAAAQAFRDYEMPFNSDSSFWGDLTEICRRTFRTEADYRNYIAQMRQMRRYFTEQVGQMRAGLARGFTPPKVTLIGRDGSAASIADARTAEEIIWYKPFADMPASFSPALAAALREEGASVIREVVIPAHQGLLIFLRQTYIPGARATLAAADLPDGRAYYQSKIAEFTTTDLTPDQIHAIGLAEGGLIRNRMLEVIKEVGFNGDLPAFLKSLRSDPRFYVATPQALLDRSAWICKTFDGKARDWFGRLPRARFTIRPVPADQAPFYTAGRGGPGVYLLNTYDLPSRPLYALTALTLHESAPGHAFQMPLADEQAGQPEFRRKGYISAYGEGWALYCERLGEEMGMYDTPYDRFGMLSYQAWRAARLVVDTGVHTMGWSRDRALDYLRQNTALPEREIETEVDRYISWPAQALSYYLGMQSILAGRAKAEAALGPRFDIRAFHDTVLSLGSVPLPVLTARLDLFVAGGGVGPYARVS
jgi:uncharacterized protein (DUF885 family)